MKCDLNGFLTDPWPQFVRHADLYPPSGATLPEIAAITLVVLDTGGSGHAVVAFSGQKKDIVNDTDMIVNPLKYSNILESLAVSGWSVEGPTPSAT